MRRRGNGGGRRLRLGPPAIAWYHLTWGVLTTLVLGVLVLGYNLQPGAVSLSVGDLATRTIRSPVSARYVSRTETARLRHEAEQRVEPQYLFNPGARTDAAATLDLGFDLLLEYHRQPTAGLVRQLAAEFPDLPPAALAWAREAAPENIGTVRKAGEAILAAAMGRNIRAGRDLERAKARAAIAARDLPVSAGAQEALVALLGQAIIPNSTYDAAATRAAREQARRSVKEVSRTIAVGEPIIYAREQVTAEHMDMLRAAGLINPHFDYRRMSATLALCGLLVLLLAVYISHYLPGTYGSKRQLALVSIIIAFAPAVVFLVNLAGGPRAETLHLSMLTAAGGVMAIGMLLGVQLGVVTAVMASLLLGVMTSSQFTVGTLALGSSLAGLCVVPRLWPLSQSVRAAVLLSAANAILIGSVGWLTGQGTTELGTQVALGGLWGLGSVIIAIGLVFVVQRPFDLVTNVRLLELADPNHPLLKRLMVEAPGSYSDSFMVANLAEGAAEAVGANGLLARVGAYYHDIGKLRRPYFFYENQALLGIDNVHDQISPSLSSLVITAHVRDGVELARESGLPVMVQDIIAQHHGTSLVRFFYHRACSENGEHVAEQMFRYPGPLPQGKEAAIVMLADSVFAAVWSLPDKNAQSIEEAVREVADDRLRDGQLSESDLTLRDLEVVTQHLVRILKNILLHTRIEYPDLEALQRPGNGRADQEPAKGKREPAPVEGGRKGRPAP